MLGRRMPGARPWKRRRWRGRVKVDKRAVGAMTSWRLVFGAVPRAIDKLSLVPDSICGGFGFTGVLGSSSRHFRAASVGRHTPTSLSVDRPPQRLRCTGALSCQNDRGCSTTMKILQVPNHAIAGSNRTAKDRYSSNVQLHTLAAEYH